MAIERERRFRLATLPGEQVVSEVLIRQVYWRLGNGWSLRLRRTGSDTHPVDSIAIKGPRANFERIEFEHDLIHAGVASGPDRDKLLRGVVDLYIAGSEHQIVKWRRSYIIDGDAWDIDEFMWENGGLIVAEIEVKDREYLMQVEKPEWAIEEITQDRRYDNEYLAFIPFSTW